MYQRKAGKYEQPDKGPYTYHPIISHKGKYRNWIQGYHRVVSIDPAEKNLAIRVEKRPYDAIKVETELFLKWDLTSYSTAYNNSDTSYIYSFLMDELDKYKPLFRQAHFVLIERQMAINFRMTRLFGCLVSYFLRILKKGIHYPMIYELNSQVKSSQLGCPKGYRGSELKKWGIELALHISKYRGDDVSYNIIKKEKRIGKKDDLADTIIQIEAFFKLMGYKTTFDYLNVQTTITYSMKINPKNNVHLPQNLDLSTFMNISNNTSITTPVNNSSIGLNIDLSNLKL